MKNKQQHKEEVLAFLQNHIANQSWEFTLPKGWGNETYIACSSQRELFVKLNARFERYQAAASIGLTVPVLAAGFLEDGTAIMVQNYIRGKRPNRSDYRSHLAQFAHAIDQLHHSPEVQQALPQASSDHTSILGKEALARLRKKWEMHRSRVPRSVDFIEKSLDQLEQQIGEFKGIGLTASHNDICNYNWLLADDGKLFLLDLESMSLDDPALDIGATLWWYYPPELRPEFLKITSHINDSEFQERMRVRMSMHCLDILLPREQSFDEFDPASFEEDLTDFRACLAGEENPQGYGD